MAKIFNYDPRDPEFYNPIINGNLDFWQRSAGNAITRISSGSSGGYVADRVRNAVAGGVAKSITIQRSTNIPITNYPLIYSCQITNNTAVASFPAGEWVEPFAYSGEGITIRPFVGQNLTLGFWLFASVVGTYTVAFRRNNSSRSYVTTVTVSTANIWEYKVVQIPWDTAVAQSYDTASPGFSLVIGAVTGTTLQAPTLNTWETANRTSHASATNWAATAGAIIRIAQVQLRSGYRSLEDMRDGFVPFAPTYDQELAACLRYFEKSYNLEVAPGTPGAQAGQIKNTTTGTAIRHGILFKVRKRAAPICTVFNPFNGDAGSARSEAATNGAIGASASTISENGFSTSDGNLLAASIWDIQYTADAEF